MEPLGTVLADLVSTLAGVQANINKHAHAVALAARDRSEADLSALGIDPGRAQDLLHNAWDGFVSGLELCESPIEQMMLAALSHMVVADAFPPAVHNVMSGDDWPESAVVIAPQFVIARYRIDFLVVADGKKIAIECDGADFHDSIDDRRRDAKRDIYLRALGIHSLRYSGQWIWKNRTRGMADEIAALLVPS